jgi:hypothetical protein
MENNMNRNFIKEQIELIKQREQENVREIDKKSKKISKKDMHDLLYVTAFQDMEQIFNYYNMHVVLVPKNWYRMCCDVVIITYKK